MAFNRRGGRRNDRGDRRGSGGWQPREGREPGGWQPRDARGGRDRDREREGSFGPRRFERRDDEGGMSLRLDPRRLAALKRAAGELGLRPGELARQWIEERIDAERTGTVSTGPGADALRERIEELAERVAALEASAAQAAAVATQPTGAATQPTGGTQRVTAESPDVAAASPEPIPAPAKPTPEEVPAPRRRGRPRKAVPAGPRASTDARGPRVALHDEIIAVLSERGPSTAAEIATAILERGRYAPPRSAKPLDAATVNSRVSNPVYRSRFVRSDGRIGLAATSSAPDAG